MPGPPSKPAPLHLKYQLSPRGVHHLVNVKTGKTVAVVIGAMYAPGIEEERIARTLAALWNEHVDGKGS